MKKLMMGLVTLGFVGLLSAPAEASVIRITISSTTCSVACPTQTIFGVGNAATFVGTFGDVSLSINAFSNNPGNTESALLTQTDIAAKSLGSDAEQITVDISQQDFNLPIGPAILGSAVSGTGASGATSVANLTTGYGSGNAYSQYSFSPPVVTCNLAGIAVACGNTSATAITSASPYSLSNRFVIDLPAGGLLVSYTGTSTVTAVPDGGATMALLGMSMAGLGFIARRRK